MNYKFLIFLFFPIISYGYSCANSGKYCKGMKSCSEAYYYYKNCGKSRLDRDKDGIPCEKICGKTKEQLKQKLRNKS